MFKRVLGFSLIVFLLAAPPFLTSCDPCGKGYAERRYQVTGLSFFQSGVGKVDTFRPTDSNQLQLQIESQQVAIKSYGLGQLYACEPASFGHFSPTIDSVSLICEDSVSGFPKGSSANNLFSINSGPMTMHDANVAGWWKNADLINTAFIKLVSKPQNTSILKVKARMFFQDGSALLSKELVLLF